MLLCTPSWGVRGITIPFIAVRQFTRISCFVSEFQSPDVCLYRVLTLPSLIYALDTISSNTSIDSIVYCCILRVVVSPSTFTCSMLYCTSLPSSRSSQCHNQSLLLSHTSDQSPVFISFDQVDCYFVRHSLQVIDNMSRMRWTSNSTWLYCRQSIQILVPFYLPPPPPTVPCRRMHQAPPSLLLATTVTITTGAIATLLLTSTIQQQLYLSHREVGIKLISN